MTVDNWTLFVLTVLVLMSTPGPSHLLMLSTSAANGFQRSFATAAGDLSANALQIGLAGSGLVAILSASSYGFTAIKWGGVLYLIWLGIKMISSTFGASKDPVAVQRSTLRQLWLRGFITSAANPKAVVFFAALFPQFIDPSLPIFEQVLLLGLTYLIIDGLFLSAYGIGADWIAKRLNAHLRPWVNRVAGASLFGAAILLGLKSARSAG